MAGTRWVVGSWSNPEIKSTSGAIGRGSHALLAHGRWVSAQKCKTVRNESRARALATTLHSSHGTGRVGVDTYLYLSRCRHGRVLRAPCERRIHDSCTRYVYMRRVCSDSVLPRGQARWRWQRLRSCVRRWPGWAKRGTRPRGIKAKNKQERGTLKARGSARSESLAANFFSASRFDWRIPRSRSHCPAALVAALCHLISV